MNELLARLVMSGNARMNPGLLATVSSSASGRVSLAAKTLNASVYESVFSCRQSVHVHHGVRGCWCHSSTTATRWRSFDRVHAVLARLDVYRVVCRRPGRACCVSVPSPSRSRRRTHASTVVRVRCAARLVPAGRRARAPRMYVLMSTARSTFDLDTQAAAHIYRRWSRHSIRGSAKLRGLLVPWWRLLKLSCSPLVVASVCDRGRGEGQGRPIDMIRPAT